MITNSMAHVLQPTLQYLALIIALFLVQWTKDVFPLSRLTHTTFRHYTRKGRSTYALILDELFILYTLMKRLRQRHNLTQEEFAEKMGVTVRTVQRWEQGVRPQPRHYNRVLLFQKGFVGEQHTQSNQYNAGGDMVGGEKYYRLYVPPQVPMFSLVISLLVGFLTFIALIGLLVFLALHFWPQIVHWLHIV
jgi:DNA-binding transcriptional regulator YiaG